MHRFPCGVGSTSLSFVHQIIGVEHGVGGDGFQSCRSERADVHVAAEQNSHVAEKCAHASDRLRWRCEPKCGLPADLRGRDDRSRKIGGQEVADGDRPGTRTACSVRPGERLVDVEVHHVAAEIARPRDAQNGVHVGAVDIDQAADVVQHLGDLRDLVSKRPRVFGLVIMNTAVFSSSSVFSSSRSTSPVLLTLSCTHSKPARAALAGLVPWALAGNNTRVRRFASIAKVSRRHEECRQLALGSRRRLQRDGRQSRDFAQHLLQLVEHLQHALRILLGLIRMQVGEAGQAGEPLVPFRVVLHRATAERIEVRVDRHVERREIDEVADHVGLRQLGQGWGVCAEVGRRDQLVERLCGHIACRKEAPAPPGVRQLKKGLSCQFVSHELPFCTFKFTAGPRTPAFRRRPTRPPSPRRARRSPVESVFR